MANYTLQAVVRKTPGVGDLASQQRWIHFWNGTNGIQYFQEAPRCVRGAPPSDPLDFFLKPKSNGASKKFPLYLLVPKGQHPPRILCTSIIFNIVYFQFSQMVFFRNQLDLRLLKKHLKRHLGIKISLYITYQYFNIRISTQLLLFCFL